MWPAILITSSVVASYLVVWIVAWRRGYRRGLDDAWSDYAGATFPRSSQ